MYTALWMLLLSLLLGLSLHVSREADVTPAEAASVLENSSYNLRSVKSPVLSGWLLQIFARTVQTPLIGPCVLSLLKKENQMAAVRQLAAAVQETPLYYPLPEPSSTFEAIQTELAETFSLDSFSRQNHNLKIRVDGFRHWSIRDYTSRYQSGQLSPVAVAQAVIRAVQHSNRQSLPLLAVISMDHAELLAQAHLSLTRYQSGRVLGVLDGVPVAVKDSLDVRGLNTSHGSRVYGTTGPAEADCEPVQRLREAGALIIGKTNMHEIGLGTTGFNQHFGTARNPYHMGHYTGGSSSGSASVVASGIVPLAVGVDGGGSIRIPASLCGIVGLKGTFNRIPFDGRGAPSVAHAGPMAASVKDAALAYAVMAGPRVGERQPAVHVATFDNVADLSDLRLGVFQQHWASASEQVRAEGYKTLAYLASLGATVVNITIPHMHETHMAHSITILSEMASHQEQHFSTRASDFSLESQIGLALGQQLSSRDFLAAQKVRRYALKEMQKLFATTVDVIVSPATGSTAPAIPEKTQTVGESNLKQTADLMRFIVHGNFVGIPGLVVPVGYDQQQLPIAVQLQADHWQEDTLLRVGKACEGVFANEGLQKPKLYYSIIDEAQKLNS